MALIEAEGISMFGSLIRRKPLTNWTQDDAAFVVLVVCLIQSESFRKTLIHRWKTRRYPAEKELTRHA